MSLNSALNNAASGLSSSARLADTISNNVANAMTPGFGRRSTELTSLSLGGYGSGVRVLGATRAENAQITAERRVADAALGASATLTEGYDRMMAALGEPTSAASLAAKATAFETAMIAATASPNSFTKLNDAVGAAKGLAASVNAAANENMRLRNEADAEIARQVRGVNTALHAIDDLNRKIQALHIQGADTNALQDERGRLIDGISSVIPIRTVRREGEQIALYSQNGGVMLDSRVYELTFTRGPAVITPDMTLGAPLSGLGQERGGGSIAIEIGAGDGRGLMDGGSLGALFELRDRIVPEVDGDLDRYAEDLIGRMRDLAPAAALDGAGDGLFVDPDAGALTGLAGRIAVNAAADPASGGAAWRLRDGLAAAAPGPESFGDYLEGIADAMSALRTPTGFVSQTGGNSSAGFAAEISSFFAGQAARSDDRRAFLTGQQSLLAEREIDVTGVDADAELQSLMLVEQAYAANARVLSAIDGLLKQLLEI